MVFHAEGGEVVLAVEVAKTENEKAVGLMNRTYLAPDNGMIFIWDSPVREGFWMKNTHIPLSIAFIDTNGIIIDIQDMEPETLATHTPSGYYVFAVEANQGYFASHGIRIGDQSELDGIQGRHYSI